ncbi:MAG: NADH-quinone oxidoreductase subunit NuoG, partial [Terriglobales bacterium]
MWHGQAIAPEAALGQLAALIAAGRNDPPGRILAIASPRASLETNFALRQLAGADRFYAALRPGEMVLAKRILALQQHWPSPSLRQIETCDAVLILGEDVSNVAARLALSLRQSLRQQPLREISDPLHIPRWLDHAAREATQDAHGPLFIATPAATRLDELAARCFRAAPADLARLGFAVAHALDATQPDASEWTAPAGEIARALLTAERPLVIAGMSSGSAETIEAAAAVRSALAARGHAAELSLLVPDCNTLGLALLDPLPLEDGLEMSRHTDLAVVAEADVFRCAPPDAAGRFCAHFRDGRSLVVLDEIRHATSDAAALLLPAAGVFHGDGTLVSQEGRAQRFFRVFEPNPNIREAWRWLVQAQGQDPTLDEMTATVAATHPLLAAIASAAPPAGFRRAGQKIAQETHRFSGRTA